MVFSKCKVILNKFYVTTFRKLYQANKSSDRQEIIDFSGRS
jgi:hypothetical protein